MIQFKSKGQVNRHHICCCILYQTDLWASLTEASCFLTQWECYNCSSSCKGLNNLICELASEAPIHICMVDGLHTARCTLHAVHCTLYIARCTLLAVHCTLHTAGEHELLWQNNIYEFSIKFYLIKSTKCLQLFKSG